MLSLFFGDGLGFFENYLKKAQKCLHMPGGQEIAC